jgi:hypothetical protein
MIRFRTRFDRSTKIWKATLAEKALFPERAANRRARLALAEVLEGEFQDIISAWSGEIDVKGLQAAVTSGGNVSILDQAAGVGRLQARLATRIPSVLEDTLDAGAHIGLRFAPPGLSGVRPGLAQEVAASFIDTQALSMATSISESTAAGMRQELMSVLTDEISPTEAARRIGRSAGLDPRRQQAVRNFREATQRRMIPTPDADTPAARRAIDEQVERYRLKQLKDRGETIAETEISEAIQEGERAFYEVAVSEGEIQPAQIQVTWMTSQEVNVCKICRPLHGVVIGFAAAFASPAARDEIPRPPAHPRCHCHLEYEVLELSEAA